MIRPSSRVRSALMWLAVVGLVVVLKWRLPVAADMDEFPEQTQVLSHPEMAASRGELSSIYKIR